MAKICPYHLIQHRGRCEVGRDCISDQYKYRITSIFGRPTQCRIQDFPYGGYAPDFQLFLALFIRQLTFFYIKSLILKISNMYSMYNKDFDTKLSNIHLFNFLRVNQIGDMRWAHPHLDLPMLLLPYSPTFPLAMNLGDRMGSNGAKGKISCKIISHSFSQVS